MTVPFPEVTPPTYPLTDDLIQAARYGDMEDVRAALAQGAVIDSQDEQGRTALHMAAANGHSEIVQLLLENGANANVGNVEGNTPLHYAALNEHIQIVQELISRGANVSALNGYDRTPMDEALSKGNAAIADAINASALAMSVSSAIIP